MRTKDLTLLLPLLVGLVAVACKANWPAAGPERSCVDACTKLALAACDELACKRGCNFVVDRLVEKQQDTVLSCVAKVEQASKRCDDQVWATCAPRVGPYRDGGPPAHEPASDVFDEE